MPDALRSTNLDRIDRSPVPFADTSVGGGILLMAPGVVVAHARYPMQFGAGRTASGRDLPRDVHWPHLVPLSAAMKNCPLAATELPTDGQGNCPLVAMRSAHFYF